MIEEAAGRIEYDEYGSGPTIVLVPGSCSTGAAWRPVIAALGGKFRCVTTSLLGYGATAERRGADSSIFHETDVVESVIRKAGGPVHLVGHSFGGLVALATALRNRVLLASLTILEAPAVELLRECDEAEPYSAFRRLTDAYFSSFDSGNTEAVATMIDFYGGSGTFASWPQRVRTYAMDTTAVNIRDWASAYGFSPSPELLSAVDLPVLIVRGADSHPAIQRANVLLSEHMRDAALITIEGAAHFMIATHAGAVARLIGQHVHIADRDQTGRTMPQALCPT